MSEFKRRWQGFWQVADPKIWVASTVPMITGAALVYYLTNTFNFAWFLVALAAVYLIEIGKNAINECVDARSGVDLYIAPDKKTPFSGGKKTIVDKKLTFAENALIGFLTVTAAILIGFVIVFFREFKVLWVGMAGIFCALFYSLPPFKFCYRGIGEFIVGFTFGPLIVLGIFIVLTKEFSWSPVLTGIPLGFLIANVLVINEFPDYEADKDGNKKNLVVRFGKKRSVVIYALLFAGNYSATIGLAFYFRNPLFLVTFATLPLVLIGVKNAFENYDNIPKLIKSNALTVLIYQLTGLLLLAVFLGTRIYRNWAGN